MGKPGTTERAVAQLLACSSQEILLHTAVCVLGPGQLVSTHRDDTRLTFRTLRQDEISRYVEREQPLDCAGSFKIEGLGIALFSAVQTADPTAIQGLPLIWLAACLERHGVAVL
jgi:septum formation protein